MANDTERAEVPEHTSKQFDTDLEEVREMVLRMGGLVEEQITEAVRALVEGDSELGEEVARADTRVNRLEVAIDEECTRILARRAPQASDLRLIIAIIKTITDLERIGDEAEKIARMATQLAGQEHPDDMLRPISVLSHHVQGMLGDVLDAFARFDLHAALQVAHADADVDREYEGIMRQCVMHMMEDPRTIRHVFDTIWAVKALERIGDHATNIGEYVVYYVAGKDVRHLAPEQVEREVASHTRQP